MNRDLTIALILASGASTALAQFGTATITWEADDGRGWTSTRLETTAPSVQVRMRVAWGAASEVGYMVAGVQFDALIQSPRGALDSVANPLRPGWFAGGSAQTIVATRFGDALKIDDSRDTLPPGVGSRGVFPGQLVEAFGGPYDRSNPATVFTFRLDLDTIPGTRTINSLYVAPFNGDTISRYLRLYTSPSGAQNRPNTTTLPLEIVFIPAPSAAMFASLISFAICGTRRRR